MVDQQRRRIGQNLDRIDRRRYISKNEATHLIRAAYSGTRPRRTMGHARTLDALRAHGKSVGTSVQVGDVLYFQSLETVPATAIVRRVYPDGRILALGPWRGQLRPIRVHLKKPSTRRESGRIFNSFIRQKKPGDSAKSGYLAGELVVDVRRYLGYL